jgi:hypothetical protein
MVKAIINISRLGESFEEKDIDVILAVINEGTNLKSTIDGEADFKKRLIARLITWLNIPRQEITREIISRYIKATPADFGILFTLAKPEIIEQRIVAPLESAKRFACLGEFLGSIALSGLVGEILTVFVWDLNKAGRKDKNHKFIEDQSLFKGRNFDKLQQSLRINIIEAFNYIDSVQAEKFRQLSLDRNKILHSWTDSFVREELEATAISCYLCAASLMKTVFKIKLADASSISMDPKVAKYLEQFDVDQSLTIPK